MYKDIHLSKFYLKSAIGLCNGDSAENSTKLKILIILIFHFFTYAIYSQHLVINEIQSSNFETIADNFGEYEDWIELYNGTDSTINLSGYTLSDNFTNLDKWILPEITIEPQEFLLVFASGKDIDDGVNLHTNFSISKYGEPVILSNHEGEIVDYLAPVYIPTDYSYGRSPDGSVNLLYFGEPSPGYPNSENVFYEILSPVIFSHTGGFYSDDFTLQLWHPDPDVTIVYTLDGSEPNINNLDGTSYFYKNEYPFRPRDDFGELLERRYYSHIYNSPIKIRCRANEQNVLSEISTTVHKPDYFPVSPVFKGTVVRAIAIKEKAITDEISTNTYFIHKDGREKFSLPVISISVQEDALFDYYDGIYTGGEDADEWRIQNPKETFKWRFPGNFDRRGFEYEYPANFEYFEINNNQTCLNQRIGIRIHGGGTRSFQMKSLRLYARSIYGESTLYYPFFQNAENINYKRLILRNSGQDFPTDIWEPRFTSRTLIRDGVVQNIVKRNMNFDTQEFQPCIVFINGEFWGIHNLRERYDTHYINQNYGIDNDEIDLLTLRHNIKAGDNNYYKEFLDFIENNDLSFDNNYNKVLEYIDMDNYIDYLIANIFIANTDWPGNNIDFWRKRTNGYIPDAPYGHDGRFRWMLYDTDFGYGLWDCREYFKHNTLEFATAIEDVKWPNPEWSTLLFRTFLENESFRDSFIDKFEYHLLNTFNPENAIKIIDSLANLIEPAVEMHFHRWNQSSLSKSDWQRNIDVMREFSIKRPCVIRTYIKDFFNIYDNNYAFGVCEYDLIETEKAYSDLVKLYPNPAENKIFVEFPNDIYYFNEISIVDNSGRQITNFETKVFRNILEINVSDLSNGFYLITIIADEHSFGKRFVVLR